MGCFYCDEHHEGREGIMFKVGEMKAGVLYLFKDQAHKGRCALALKAHKKELCECTDQERTDFAADLAAASGGRFVFCSAMPMSTFAIILQPSSVLIIIYRKKIKISTISFNFFIIILLCCSFC